MADVFLPDGVTKKIMSGGHGQLPTFPDNSKVWFHYRAFVDNDGERKLLDDSKIDKNPFELLLGKKFKLDIWEKIIKTMRINEIAEFWCDSSHVSCYPVVSKSLRDIKNKNGNSENRHEHKCGFSAVSQGLGYKDLDEYMKNPKPIIFQIELLSVELPGNFEQDIWSLSAKEQIEKIPIWKEQGNLFYKNGDLDSASEKYSQALGCLEKLSTMEKPGSVEWLKIDKMKIVFLLNFSQCMIAKKEYYKAIEHLTTVLEKDKQNTKALYRRANAYQSVYDYASARSDYRKVIELDETLLNLVEKELKKIAVGEKEKENEDRKKFKSAFR